MADMSSWQDGEDDLYTLSSNDPLGVLSSTKIAVEQGEHVWINIDQVEALSKQWLHKDQTIPSSHTPVWYERYHFHDGTERTVNWLLLLDALNFCFWAEKGQSRWTIDYHREVLNGYWAEAASLTRAIEEGIPLWDAKYLSTISFDEIAHIFRGEQTIPLIEQRFAHAREVGTVLLTHFNGQFTQAIEQTGRDAVQLVQLLAHSFPSFNDTALYRKHTIRFYKRAQICVADLYGSFGGKDWGAFTNLDQLTAFADYKLPQVLRHHRVLEYASTLAERVDNLELLEPGSEEEIEIRANTIWACELLRRSLLRQGRVITASEIDQRLWLAGQNSVDMRPYHRTRTIYY